MMMTMTMTMMRGSSNGARFHVVAMMSCLTKAMHVFILCCFALYQQWRRWYAYHVFPFMFRWQFAMPVLSKTPRHLALLVHERSGLAHVSAAGVDDCLTTLLLCCQ